MPKLTVNENEIEFEQGMTVLQACEVAGAEIPRFCYHERLEIAGNCRMCLVQIEGGPPKPAASCAMPAAEGMKIHTDTPMVKKAREGVMEFLLANHPLDCPICDQGGECDLQDQAISYGRGSSRFDENKRAVKDKYMGPLVKTHMTRCIQCTRCIRFLDDVAGVQELGAVNRGENMAVSTYVEKSLTSELSGNIIDLCPVGALTSKPYAFKARSWELRKTESIDVLDAVGSNIRIDAKGKEVLRILPALNEEINEEWISDKTRFSYDGLKLQRLDRPYIKKEGRLTPVSWEEAYKFTADKLSQTSPEKISALAGSLSDCESMLVLKELMHKLGSKNIDCNLDGAKFISDNKASYRFNTTISGIEEADFCLIVGCNPRVEASIINARIRKAHLKSGLQVALIGEKEELNYPYQYLGNHGDVLTQIANGDHEICKKLESAKKPMIILGANVATLENSESVFATAYDICEKYNLIQDDFNGFNVLHNKANVVGGLDIGFVPQDEGKYCTQILESAKNKDMEVVYLLGADEIDTSKLEDSFVIYQGHHGDKGAHVADVIFPSSAYTEKNATYVNTEGRVQQTSLAVFPLGDAKEDWLIVNELSNYLKQELGYLSIEDVREKLTKFGKHFVNIGEIIPHNLDKITANEKVLKTTFANPIKNFYMTDTISRSSKTMAKCVSDILKQAENKEAAA